MNNEVVGISAELAIADTFNLHINPRYRELVVRELSHILENPTSPILDVINVDKVWDLVREEEMASRPWFGQLMRGPQVMAFFIQLNNWLKEYRVKIV